MPTTKTRSSTTSKYDRTQRSHSYAPQAPADETHSTVSDASDLVMYRDVEAVRQVHAEAFKKVPERHRREHSQEMASHTPRRTYSDSRAYETKNVKEVVSEVRRRDSRHRPRSQRPRGEECGDRDDMVYNSDKRRVSGEEAERRRPRDLRRAKTTGATSKAKQERSYKDREPERRHSERWISHQEEHRYHAPLRREKRSVADVSKPRRVEPPKR